MLKSLLLAAGVSAAALAAHAAPYTDLRIEPTQLAVSTRGVDFADPAQVRAFHRLLARTAASLCESRNPGDLGVVASDRACASEALDRAVEQTQAPLLTAYHQGSPISPPARHLASR